MVNIFSKEILDILFHCDGNGCLLTPESYDIEYKESLNISSDLFKAMNGLANNKGGFIICGVEPTSRELKGLSPEKIEFYNTKIDSEEMRGKILSSCQPNLEYKHFLHNIGTAKFVIFYIEESKNKPHVFLNSADEVKQGDIYYRYNDSVKKIQYAELSSIIENKRVKEQEKWMKFLGEIAKIGLDDVLIIDGKNGRLITSDSKENGIIIDESVLSKFKLIKEGHFHETVGEPTLKLIGNINVVGDSTKYELTSDITALHNPSETHPFRFSDITKELEKNQVKTKDGILITNKNIHYSRIRFFIINNGLDKNIEDIYFDKDYSGYQTKKFSYKVYNMVKEAFETMTLEEILAIREIKKEQTDEQ